MTQAELLLESLDQAHWELSEALGGMPDADFWKRPSPELLSVGELICHIATGEAASFIGREHSNPLVTPLAGYYESGVNEPFQLPLTVAEAWAELEAVHKACCQAFADLGPDLDALNPLRGDWTWRYTLQYMAFHVAYHAGQIYSVRHLLGHKTPNN